MATPVFISVTYIDPWGIIPPGSQNTGVLVTVSATGAPAAQVLIGRLLQAGQPLAYGIGGSATFLFVRPPGPLTVALPYQVQVQWAPTGSDPSNANWSGAQVATAPVITSGVLITGGTVGGGTLALSWEPTGSAQPAYGVVQLFNTGTGQAKVVLAAGGSGQWAWAPTAGQGYAAYVQAAALINPSVPNVYTSGPLSPPVPVPIAAPVLTSAAYDGSTLSVAWTAPTLPATPVAVDVAYSLVLLSGTTRAASFPGDAGGGTAVAELAPLGTALTVAGSVSYGVISGPVGTGQTLLPAAPAVSAASLAPGTTAGQLSLTATVTPPPGLPTGATVQVQLLKDGAVAATQPVAGGTATLTFTPAAGSRYAVAAAAAIAAGTGTPAVAGPASAALPLVTGTPGAAAAAYDGNRLDLAWTGVADPALTGYRVVVTGGAAGMYVTGPEPLLSLPATLNVGTASTVSVIPLAGAVSGPASTAATFTVPAPGAPQVVQAAVQDGTVALAWSPSAGPWLDGYRVTLTGTTDQGTTTRTLYTGLETSAVFPLPAATVPTSWSAAVAATARGTAGTAASVALLPAVAVVTGVSVSGTTATVSWALSPGTAAVLSALSGASAAVQVQLLDAGNVVAAASTPVTTSATGSTAVTLPSPTSARLTAAAQLAAGTQTGSRGGPAPVLAAAPVIAFGSLLDGALSLRWSASGDQGVTGYTVAYGGTSVTTSDTSATLPLGSMPVGNVTVTPVGGGSTGPAATQAVVAGYAVQSATYTPGTLSVTLAAAGTPAPATLWVDVLVNGALAARTAVGGAPTGAVAVPVTLPPGAAAVVRATGVGAGSLTAPSTPVAVPSTPLADAAAVWDGTTLRAAWTPVPDPGVTGYLVSVAGATPAVTPVYVAGAGTASASIPAAFAGAFPGSAQVTVQAVVQVSAGNYAAGPAGAAAVPSLAGAVRGVGAAAAAQPPYVYRRGIYTTLATAQAANVVVYLANVFSSGTPTAQDTGATFVLAPVATPLAGGPAYSLTIDKSVWTSFDGSAARATLRAAYRAFLVAVEGKGVQPWGIALVRQAVAAALPQTFAETLYYRYGVWQDGSLRVVDLEPGLRLRVDGAVYQSPSASSDPRIGYLSLGSQTYDLAEVFPAGSAQASLSPALTVDAFLTQLLPGGGTPGPDATVAAGAMDFFGPGAREAYFRLFYPKAPGGVDDALTYPDSGGIGSSSPLRNVALIGAASWTTLENATDQYASQGSFPATGLWTAYFRGRASLTPLLALTVGTDTRWVAPGTTLRQVLATLGLAPSFGASAGGEVSLARAAANVFDYPQGGPPLRAEGVDLSGADLGGLAPQLWPLDVPVLGGDAVQLSPAVSPGT